MLICRNAKGVRGQRRVGNPWSRFSILNFHSKSQTTGLGSLSD